VNREGIPGTQGPSATTFTDRKSSGGGMPGELGGGLGTGQIDLRGLRVFGRLFRRLLVLGIVLALVIGGGGALIDKIGDEIDKIDTIDKKEFPSLPQSPAGREAEEPAGTPKADEQAETPAAELPATPTSPDEPPLGLQRGSLLLRANFAAVLRKMRNGGYGRLTNLRVAPERVDAQFLTQGGRLRNVQFQPGGVVRDFGTSGPGFAGARTMSIASINAAAPFRATASAAGRLKKPATQVNYLVYTDVFAGQPWGVYFKSGQYFRADDRGTITRRFS
jgi:hypothetical protein